MIELLDAWKIYLSGYQYRAHSHKPSKSRCSFCVANDGSLYYETRPKVILGVARTVRHNKYHVNDSLSRFSSLFSSFALLFFSLHIVLFILFSRNLLTSAKWYYLYVLPIVRAILLLLLFIASYLLHFVKFFWVKF